MKTRILWAVLAALGIAATLAFVVQRRAVQTKPEIAIQDGKTIDFSSGRPVVKDSAAEKAALEKAVKEMEEAAKGVILTSPPPAKPAAKK
jgi:uncharacterized protein HemX